MGTVVVTRNFQITLPKDVREQLDIRIGDCMITKREDDKIIITKMDSNPINKAFGMWKSTIKEDSVDYVNNLRKKWDRK
ncbi:MAG: AbrB/MazE/SpoVT family DNA-binding domain-containing protein [archaeon]